MDKTVVVGTTVVVGLLVVIGAVVSYPGRSTTPANDAASVSVSSVALATSVTDGPKDLVPSKSVASIPAPQASIHDAGVEFDERTLMEKLRELRVTAPIVALRLARESNAKHPNSAGSSERAWIIVKSLTDLERFDEAREEARTMVDRYRNTEWAEDVYRHVLLHPPGPPAREVEE